MNRVQQINSFTYEFAFEWEYPRNGKDIFTQNVPIIPQGAIIEECFVNCFTALTSLNPVNFYHLQQLGGPDLFIPPGGRLYNLVAGNSYQSENFDNPRKISSGRNFINAGIAPINWVGYNAGKLVFYFRYSIFA